MIVFLSGQLGGSWRQHVIQRIEEWKFIDPTDCQSDDPRIYVPRHAASIAQADIFFGFMAADNPSGYGLSAELGYAKGLNKLTFLVDERSQHDEVFCFFFQTARALADATFESLDEGIAYLKSMAEAGKCR